MVEVSVKTLYLITHGDVELPETMPHLFNLATTSSVSIEHIPQDKRLEAIEA